MNEEVVEKRFLKLIKAWRIKEIKEREDLNLWPSKNNLHASFSRICNSHQTAHGTRIIPFSFLIILDVDGNCNWGAGVAECASPYSFFWSDIGIGHICVSAPDMLDTLAAYIVLSPYCCHTLHMLVRQILSLLKESYFTGVVTGLSYKVIIYSSLPGYSKHYFSGDQGVLLPIYSFIYFYHRFSFIICHACICLW